MENESPSPSSTFRPRHHFTAQDFHRDTCLCLCRAIRVAAIAKPTDATSVPNSPLEAKGSSGASNI